MRAREFILLEYSREITAKNLGQKLIAAANSDTSGIDLDLSDPDDLDPEHDIEVILEYIESKDPTPNKRYTQWMARMYAKGGVKLEDLNRGNLIGIFDIGKRRGMIEPNNADINQYTAYKYFEDMMAGYDLDAIMKSEPDKLSKGNAEVLLDTAEVKVIYPKDEAAACYYGQGTRWCTAATRGSNYFNHYNNMGPMYILLPKHPMHTGEKYQLHFRSDQFMDENDDQIPLDNLFKERFPSIFPWFFKQYPDEFSKMLAFASDETLTPLIKQIVELSEDFLWEDLIEWEKYDSSFLDWQSEEAEKKGYVDEDGEVIWEKVWDDDELTDYLEYNYEAKAYYDRGIKALRSITPEDIRKYQHAVTDDVQYINNLENVVAELVKDRIPSRVLSNGGANLISFIQLKLVTKHGKDGWEVVRTK